MEMSYTKEAQCFTELWFGDGNYCCKYIASYANMFPFVCISL